MFVPKTLLMIGIVLGMAAAAILIAVPVLGDMGLMALRVGVTTAVASLLLVVTGLVMKDAAGIRRGD